MTNKTPVLLCLSQGGYQLAGELATAMDDVEIHGLKKRLPECAITFENTIAHVQSLFRQSRPIIGICASGILIRALAPLLSDKWVEPPVVAVAEDASCAVPLLGGHHGANELSRWIADILEGAAAITTAGELSFGLALDEPPRGWRIANPDQAKDIAAALLNNDAVALEEEAGESSWLKDKGLSFEHEGFPRIRISDRSVQPDGNELLYHPPVLALGVGCERDCPAEHMIDHALKTLESAGLSKESVACVVSVDVKTDEACVHALAEMLGVPARFFTPQELDAQQPRLKNPSDVVYKEVGCHGVAEGAALAAVGGLGELLVEKHKTDKATCAIARSPVDIQPEALGRGQGYLSVIGIGPGSDEWRSPQSTQALREATDVVGYGLYLDLVEDLIVGKERHESGLANEERRARIALDLAAEGKRVCLVCSGDAGIYALATLAFELLDKEDKPEWNRLKIDVAPGISALQACAARIGAPINHDFCTISLSDLLTPWDDIQRRLKAAADGDFVVAFYNPRSKRRVTQIEKARDILLTGRPASTPVVLGRNLGRATESMEVITLGELSSDHADMLTMVLVGSSQSRVIERGVKKWVYTPRGYEKKMKVAS
ncbi:Precorrin-3B methylase [Candidatus Terasakiella magnetica]|uniref:Precorrin-3B methylase n=1 Tax=Candidatus Terasakiella magnetica TaxID=1867952 RepID=A0A1C3RJF6_9PROT|nr:precorrin-3B C(17)-methyltransferase [Candidatus Terasakiella magnetica]SCA57363.1 Precorrin-3B methylase [Candidatus Terasakiella magnetica]